MTKLHINGKEYPFAFTYKCMREIANSKGMSEIEQSEKAFLLAINMGYKREGENTKISRDELIDLLDEDPSALSELSKALANDMGKLTGEVEEGN